MAGISGISGGMRQIWPQQIQGTSQPSATAKVQGAAKEPGFGDMLEKAVSEVNLKQEKAAVAIEDLVMGRTDDVLPVVAATAKADMSFKLLIGVRNKVVEAYKQTMNMQI